MIWYWVSDAVHVADGDGCVGLKIQSNLHRRICYTTMISGSYISCDNMTGLTVTEGTFS